MSAARRAAAVLAASAAVAVAPVAVAWAAPANDAPAGAVTVVGVLAANGTPTAREGVADLSQATADAGVPRCLGPRSFARTVWFRVPGEPTARRLRLDALTQTGEPDQAPDLAAFVQPAGGGGGTSTREPQACDGPAARAPGDQQDASTGVELRVPAGHDVLVQVGRSAGQTGRGAVLSADSAPLDPAAAPPGDLVAGARSLQRGRARTIPLRGALLTPEDPAQPACAASGTVWRKARIGRTGVQVAATRGDRANALTVFLGARPTGANAVACRAGTAGLQEIAFRARRGQVAWLRLGTDEQDAGTARLALSGPCDATPLRPVRRTRIAVAGASTRPRTARAVRLRLELAGPCVGRARVSVGRGGRVVARGAVAGLRRGARTASVPRVRGARLPAGRYRVRVAARTTDGRRVVAVTRVVRLR